MDIHLIDTISNLNLFYFYFLTCIFLWIISIWGLLSIKKNILVTLMCLELLFLSLDLLFIGFSIYLDDIWGQLFALIILTVAASEAAVGLALLVALERLKGTILINFIDSLKG